MTLVYTFNEGIMLERLSGIEDGHRELLDWIDGWLEEKRWPDEPTRHRPTRAVASALPR